MKRTRYTEQQIISILKEAEAGVPVTKLCRQQGSAKVLFTSGKPNTVAGYLTIATVERT